MNIDDISVFLKSKKEIACMTLSDWFQGFEKGISCLNEEQRASFFSECGKNCVKCGTLQIYQQLYEKANGDLDTFFSEANKLPGVKKRNH